MATAHPYTLRATLSQDAAGVVHEASEGRSERRVLLRTYTRGALARCGISAVENVAYQVAIRRLSGIAHPSLRPVLGGGCDEDGIPYLAVAQTEEELLGEQLRRKPLTPELAMTLLSQALEVCELLSHVLAEEGIWVELDPASIGVRRDESATRFAFWPAPLRSLGAQGRNIDLAALANLAETALGLSAGGRANHALGDWLDWLREEAPQHPVSLRELREVLAAAAGIDPPPPIQTLIAQSKRKTDLRGLVRGIFAKGGVRRPKMPLFALLCAMLIVQSALGWLWIRKINREFDRKIQEINRSAYDADDPDPPGEPGEGTQRGSKPLEK